MAKQPNTQGMTTGVKVYDLIVNVSGPLYGELKDWPGNIQDRIWFELEKKSHEVELPLTIIASACDKDHGAALDGSEDKYFIHVVASEIVVKDKRLDDPAFMKAMFDKVLQGGGSVH